MVDNAVIVTPPVIATDTDEDVREAIGEMRTSIMLMMETCQQVMTINVVPRKAGNGLQSV
jgi:hypothetical protein